jgi:hypothetical protein
MKAGTLAAVAETATALALMAWLGGMVALGAFSARIVFRELPRVIAGPTMSMIFRSFDGVIVVALCVLVAAGIARYVALGARGRADRIALAATAALVLLGVLDVGFVHPRIHDLFEAGRTLDPEFVSLHKLSSRSVNLEIIAAALLLGAHAFSRRASRAGVDPATAPGGQP